EMKSKFYKKPVLTSAQQTKEIREATLQDPRPNPELISADNRPDLEALGAATKQVMSAQEHIARYPNFFNPPYREPKWLTTGEAAKHIKVAPTKFPKLRAEGIKFYKLSDGTMLYNVH